MQEGVLKRYERASEAVLGAGPRRMVSDAAVYLAHVEASMPIRRIAGVKGNHPSTVLRAVRRVEAMRDDPLVEFALEAIERRAAAARRVAKQGEKGELRMTDDSDFPSREAMAALANLAEPEAFLLVAPGVDKAGVFCRKNGFRRPISLIDAASAAEFLKRDWIRCQSRTEQSARYRLT